MSKRDEVRVRQNTTLYDLLDDGVENGSDVSALARLKAEHEQSSANEISNAHRASPQHFALTTSRRSWGGAVLGFAIFTGGTAVAIWPVEMLVWHDRIRYLPSFAEHVTQDGARGYGIVVALAGLVVTLFSLVRMRDFAGRT